MANTETTASCRVQDEKGGGRGKGLWSGWQEFDKPGPYVVIILPAGKGLLCFAQVLRCLVRKQGLVLVPAGNPSLALRPQDSPQDAAPHLHGVSALLLTI